MTTAMRQWRRGKRQGGQSSARRDAHDVRAPPAKTDAFQKMDP
jgi:hypothetical protein